MARYRQNKDSTGEPRPSVMRRTTREEEETHLWRPVTWVQASAGPMVWLGVTAAEKSTGG